MSEKDMAHSQSEPGSREPSQQAVSAFGFDPSRCATAPLSQQSLRPVEAFIELRTNLSTSGALNMEH